VAEISRKMKALPRVRSQIQGTMIARLWRGYSTPEKANGYRVILLREILPDMDKSLGYGGSFVLKRQNRRRDRVPDNHSLGINGRGSAIRRSEV
jgi:hypothetical protein